MGGYPSIRAALSRETIVDALGYIWLHEYEAPLGQGSRWTVFAPNGEKLGAIGTPVPLTVFQIGVDYVLGKRLDELNVEHLEMYPLDRAGTTRPPADEACAVGG